MTKMPVSSPNPAKIYFCVFMGILLSGFLALLTVSGAFTTVDSRISSTPKLLVG